jgi:hypothetical protein
VTQVMLCDGCLDFFVSLTLSACTVAALNIEPPGIFLALQCGSSLIRGDWCNLAGRSMLAGSIALAPTQSRAKIARQYLVGSLFLVVARRSALSISSLAMESLLPSCFAPAKRQRKTPVHDDANGLDRFLLTVCMRDNPVQKRPRPETAKAAAPASAREVVTVILINASKVTESGKTEEFTIVKLLVRPELRGKYIRLVRSAKQLAVELVDAYLSAGHGLNDAINLPYVLGEVRMDPKTEVCLYPCGALCTGLMSPRHILLESSFN